MEIKLPLCSYFNYRYFPDLWLLNSDINAFTNNWPKATKRSLISVLVLILLTVAIKTNKMQFPHVIATTVASGWCCLLSFLRKSALKIKILNFINKKRG